MKYCLFIDESGDFENPKGEWLISGFLCSGSFDEVNDQLSKVCGTLSELLSVASIKDFHLTEFRRKFGHDRAIEMAKTLIYSLEKLPFKYHFLTSINHSKINIIDREKTYRMMLFDLVALFETILPEDEILEGLDLVVATRTINGVRQTNVSDIKEGIFTLLPQSLEVDLATKGLVDLIGNKISIKLDYANNLWGLVVADFIANLTYNKNRKKESDFLNLLIKQKFYRTFDSFRNHAERRAAVAERDRDYTTACMRWLITLNKTPSEVAQLGIDRSFTALQTGLGNSGPAIAFEALLDRIFRLCKPTANNHYFIELISLLKVSMQKLQAEGAEDLQKYLYRANVLLLKVVNHVGNTPLAMSLLEEQSRLIDKIVYDPDNLPMILDGALVESEIFYNALNHEEALRRATKCLRLAENYTSIASIVLDTGSGNTDNGIDSHASKIFVKAKMNYLRHAVNNLKVFDLHDQLLEDLNILEANVGGTDSSRLRSIKTHLFVTIKQYDNAVGVTSGQFKRTYTEFDKISFLRSLNVATLAGRLPTSEQTKQVEELSGLDLAKNAYPKELVYRELSIWYYLHEHPKKALKLAKMSRKSKLSNSARISDYLSAENRFLVDIYKSQYNNNNLYFDEFGFNTKHHENELQALEYVLQFSPF